MKPYKIIALLMAAIFASLIISEIGAPPAAAQGGFSDNFTTDASLNTGLWATNTPFLSSLAGITGNACCPSYVTPQLTFSGAGMQMSGVNGDLQFTGVQSVQTLTPPLTVQAEVMGTLAAGNPFVLELANGSLSQYIALFGHLGGAGANNISLSESTSYPYSGASGLNLYASPSISTEYVLNLAVDATGNASASVSDTIGNVLGSASNLSLGKGPFYVVLGQFEGEPPAPGPNTAVWSYVDVTMPTSFTFSLTPSTSQKIAVTGSVNLSVNLTSFGGFSNQVILGVSPGPPSACSAVSPCFTTFASITPPADGSASASLKITATKRAAALVGQTVQLTITGDSGNLNYEQMVTANVVAVDDIAVGVTMKQLTATNSTPCEVAGFIPILPVPIPVPGWSCASAQLNLDVNVPTETGELTYWVQDIVLIMKRGSTYTAAGACEAFTSSNSSAFQIECPAVLQLGVAALTGTPICFTGAGGLISLEAAIDQSGSLLLSQSVTSCDGTTTTLGGERLGLPSGSYISLENPLGQGIAGPPELSLVGVATGATATFGPTVGDVHPLYCLTSGSCSAHVGEQVIPKQQAETAEMAANLAWLSPTCGSDSFCYRAGSADQGISLIPILYP